VAIINESLARGTSRAKTPSERIDFNWDTKGTQEIVGIVHDIKQYGLDQQSLRLFTTVLRTERPGMTVVVRSSLAPESLVGAMRQQLLALDKEQPLARVRTMRQVVAESTAERRVMVWLLHFSERSPCFWPRSVSTALWLTGHIDSRRASTSYGEAPAVPSCNTD